MAILVSYWSMSKNLL